MSSRDVFTSPKGNSPGGLRHLLDSDGTARVEFMPGIADELTITDAGLVERFLMDQKERRSCLFLQKHMQHEVRGNMFCTAISECCQVHACK
jgi:hypothetical protein